MSDEKKQLLSSDGSSEEALKRAERIKAIKKSIHNVHSKADNVTADAGVAQQYSGEQPDAAEASEAESWDSDLADRIARRVNKVKTDKAAAKVNTAESLLNELNGLIAANEAAMAANKGGFSESDEIPAEGSVVSSEQEDDTDAQEYSYEDEQQIAFEDEAEAEQEPVYDEPVQQVEQIPDETPTDKAPVKKLAAEEEAVPKKTKKKKKKKKSFKERMLGLLPQKGDGLFESIRKVVFLGSVFAFLVFGTIIAEYYIDIYTTQNDYDNIMSDYRHDIFIPPEAPVDAYEGEYYQLLTSAKKLLAINEDCVGVINIPGTQVSYPVVQSDEHDKYLNLSFTGENAKAGSIFLDYRCSFDNIDEKGHRIEETSDNLIIYGHNMGSGMMFGSLKNYRNNVNYYGQHPVIELNSNYKCYKYKIFAFFIIDAEDKTDTAFDCWNTINFGSEDEFYDFINEAKRRTLRLNDVDMQYGDKLLTLSTCNSIFGNGGSGRLIIMARLVRDGEDPTEGTQTSVANPNIKWPTLYYNYKKNAKYDPDAEFVPYGPKSAETTTAGSEE